ncbi:RadC family protein [Bordetella sp. FB-8]|uniref:JAB domain-containing protein n=1 Tax=Bordetella sp. FB-8 TaxID=1159870 RepID=UPI000368341C|nr:JAB domain-containing protein [Bordetella sp. FB-8]
MLQLSLFALPIAPAVPALPAGAGELEHAALCVRDAAGLRPATPIEIMDAGRRAIDASIPRGAQLNHPDQVKDYFLAKLGGMQREVMGIAYLTNQLQLIAYEEPFGGTLSQCAAYPREVVKRALQLNAAAILIGHPHPSGLASPSSADIEFTRQIQKALQLVDVRLLDHVIVAGNQVVSLAQQGHM